MPFKKWALFGAFLLLPLAAYADVDQATTNPIPPYLNISGVNQLDGVSINPNTAAAGNFSTLNAAAVTTQGTVFSTALTGNPIELTHFDDVTLAQVNASKTILTGVVGRQIYPGAMSIEAIGGNAATCTSVKVICNPSTILIGTFNIAQLTSGVPVGLQSASVTAGSGGIRCPSGDSIVVSAVGGGGCATATDFFVSFPYTVQ